MVVGRAGCTDRTLSEGMTYDQHIWLTCLTQPDCSCYYSVTGTNTCAYLCACV